MNEDEITSKQIQSVTYRGDKLVAEVGDGCLGYFIESVSDLCQIEEGGFAEIYLHQLN